MHRFSIALVTVIAALSAIPAAADTASVQVTGDAPNAHGVNQLLAATVQYGDLDLTTSSGAATLLGRIETASQSVCNANSEAAARYAEKIATCRKRAVTNAVQQVDAPLLTQAATAQ